MHAHKKTKEKDYSAKINYICGTGRRRANRNARAGRNDKENRNMQQVKNQGLDFIAIDFETATGKRASVCEVGICVVRNGEIIETRSWLVHPEDNLYSYWNMQCHGITPEETENSPFFPEVWEEIERLYLDEFNILVAHNAPFDRSCLEHSARLYNLHLPELQWQCTLKIARQIYDFGCNTLGYLCKQLAIPEGTHHRAGDDAQMCARLFLREMRDAGWRDLAEIDCCNGKL